MKKEYKKHDELHHTSISVEGVLNQFKRKAITFWAEDDGSDMAPAKAKQVFMQARYEGKKVLPMSNECYRFDHQKGCKGHILSLMPTSKRLKEINNE